jgi:hypothetical protein
MDTTFDIKEGIDMFNIIHIFKMINELKMVCLIRSSKER